jgi:hypothetical protein
MLFTEVTARIARMEIVSNTNRRSVMYRLLPIAGIGILLAGMYVPVTEGSSAGIEYLLALAVVTLILPWIRDQIDS